jgi:prepilin-type N-terminal cleavage/methylation domain-containing protein
MLKKLLKEPNNNRGYTLVEMLVAIAIVAIITSSISAVIVQTISVSAANKNEMQAIKQVENAMHWIDRDAQQAWATDALLSSPSTFHWIDNSQLPVQEHQVSYTLDIDTRTLYRSDSITGENSLVATDISELDWTCVKNPDGKYLLTVNITARVEGYKPGEESRTLLVMPRASR